MRSLNFITFKNKGKYKKVQKAKTTLVLEDEAIIKRVFSSDSDRIDCNIRSKERNIVPKFSGSLNTNRGTGRGRGVPSSITAPALLQNPEELMPLDDIYCSFASKFDDADTEINSIIKQLYRKNDVSIKYLILFVKTRSDFFYCYVKNLPEHYFYI